MNSWNEEPEICPLLSAASGDLRECEKGRCAWYIPPKRPESKARCAVVDIADSLDGINIYGVKVSD